MANGWEKDGTAFGNGKTDVIRENLTENTEAGTAETEKRLAFLCDCADEMTDRLCHEAEGDLFLHGTDENIRRTYRALYEDMIASSPAYEAANEASVSFRSRFSGRADSYFLCKRIIENLGKVYTGRDATQLLFGECRDFAGQSRKIGFMHNLQTGRAFECFARSVFGALTDYHDSFALSCEAVTEGECTYAILPLRNSVDGRLTSFYKMLDKYELGILLCTDIENQNGDVARYALVCSGQGFLPASGTVKFECRITLDSCAELASVSEMADFFGVTLDSVDAVPNGRTEQGGMFAFCFSFENAPLAPFLFCLQMEYPQLMPTGLYTLVKGAKWN